MLSNAISPTHDLNHMISDAVTFLSHVTTFHVLCALMILALAIFGITRAKSALVVALSAAIYLLPFVINGKLP